MIHPTAIIHPKAQLDSTVSVGPCAVIDEHGPQSVGVYFGSGLGMDAAGYRMMESLFSAIGTPAKFSPLTIDGTAKSLTGKCLAVMGVDQIFHGTRPGAPNNEGDEEVLFFNINNIEAARTNARGARVSRG